MHEAADSGAVSEMRVDRSSWKKSVICTTGPASTVLGTPLPRQVPLVVPLGDLQLPQSVLAHEYARGQLPVGVPVLGLTDREPASQHPSDLRVPSTRHSLEGPSSIPFL